MLMPRTRMRETVRPGTKTRVRMQGMVILRTKDIAVLRTKNMAGLYMRNMARSMNMSTSTRMRTSARTSIHQLTKEVSMPLVYNMLILSDGWLAERVVKLARSSKNSASFFKDEDLPFRSEYE